MADKKISELTAAGALTGTELVEVVQGGVNKQSTTQDIADLGGGAVDSVNGQTGDVVLDVTTREFNRAWSSELLFDKNVIEYEEHTLTDDVEFTISDLGNLTDQDCSILAEIITDGTHTVTFTGFKYVLGDVQSGSIPEAGTYPVMFYYSNGRGIAIWGQPSSEVSNLTPLAAPANLTAVPGTDPDTEMDITSDAVPNASSYQLDFSTSGGGGPWTNIPEATGTSYTHTGRTPGATYHYRRRAMGDLVVFANSAYSITAGTTEDSGDATAPTFVFSPADAATGIPVNQVVTITASAPLRDQDGVTEIVDGNLSDYLTVKEDNIAGANIPYTATIDVTKTIITITPNVIWPALGDVFIQIDGVEGSINGVNALTDDATFTASDYTAMSANYLNLGTQIDSVVVGDDINFELEAEYDEFLIISGTKGLFQKYSAVGNNKSILVTSNGTDVSFKFYGLIGPSYSSREIIWTNALAGFSSGKLTFEYDGAIDTNNGIDRVKFYIDDVEITSGKSLVASGATWPFAITGGTAPFYLSGPTFREVRNFKVRNNAGATTIVDIPIIRTGTDNSGNSFDGTWV